MIILANGFGEVDDCPACFGSGATISRELLDLAAFVGVTEYQQILAHSSLCGEIAAPCWCTPPRSLGELLNALRRGWGYLPGVLALLELSRDLELGGSLALDQAGMSFAVSALQQLLAWPTLDDALFEPVVSDGPDCLFSLSLLQRDLGAVDEAGRFQRSLAAVRRWALARVRTRGQSTGKPATKPPES